MVQYMPLKPTKRGYKIWCRCDAKNGYLSEFSVYVGTDATREESLSTHVVKKN